MDYSKFLAIFAGAFYRHWQTMAGCQSSIFQRLQSQYLNGTIRNWSKVIVGLRSYDWKKYLVWILHSLSG